MQSKQEAYRFLKGLQGYLETNLLAPELVEKYVGEISAKPKSERTPQELVACGENLCLYLTLPYIQDYMIRSLGMDVDSAKESLRCEYYDKFPELSATNSFRRQGHPFGKGARTLSTQDIMTSWKRSNSSTPANQAYPDACLSEPFPFPTIFEAKYFNLHTVAAAEKALVDGVYEVVHYRGLPWEYEYGCLLAYDASSGALLKETWGCITSKRLFWEDANVFVMIVRGSNRNPIASSPSKPAQ